MDRKILVCYQGVTGFTKKYAEMIANEMNCALMNLKDVTAQTVSQYDIVVFGGRCFAGSIDGLKKAKKLAASGGKKTFVVFATGATPNAAEEVIQSVWERNFAVDELQRIPRFYMQGGLCYEKMPWHEKLMMKAFATVMKAKIGSKKEKAEEDREFERMISGSYDISSKEYIEPLVSCLKEKGTQN